MLRDHLQHARQFLEGSMSDVTAEQAQWLPPGTSNPLGATYAHVALGEDTFVSLLRGTDTLASGEWADRLGMEPSPPSLFPPQPWQDWGRQVKVDLAAVRDYGQSVFESTENYVGGLSDEDLDRPIDLSALGFGQPALSWAISNAVISHRLVHWGEIACLKGMQGQKGLPF
jgi:DinB superfamily